MIRLTHVSARYTPETEVLKSVDLHLEAGGFYFLSGGSGAGKSTLMRILSLTKPASGGTVEAFGQRIDSLSHADLPSIRRKIGLVVQDYHLLDHLTVRENVALPLKIAGEKTSEIREKVQELLEWVDIADHADMYPPTLSGGQKQRAAIARAVIRSPELILADEPTGNLDPALSLKVMYLFQALNKMGTAVLFATHDENLISLFDYPVLHLKDGVLTRRS
ncbi:MAG: ATP-binding cassette domain-containing protein [Alphaproteobacteria bacterium]|nr:ATP-binding cassette domain-containing protein [Alphaproteobacteria bacterium]